MFSKCITLITVWFSCIIYVSKCTQLSLATSLFWNSLIPTSPGSITVNSTSYRHRHSTSYRHFALWPYSNYASKLRYAVLFPFLLTSHVSSSRAPVPLERIVYNLSSHITIPVAITTVKKDGTFKTKIANDGQRDVSLIRSANTVENENPVQHGILYCKQGTCLQELSRIGRLAGIEWFGHWYTISYRQKVQKVCFKHSISDSRWKLADRLLLPIALPIG